MTSAFRALDDFLIDRVFQPLVDFAAGFEVKTRHLMAATYLIAAGVVCAHFHETFPFGALTCIILFFLSLYIFPSPLGTRTAVGCFVRMFNLAISIFLSSMLLEAVFMLFCLLMVAALYLQACVDKPPKRRRRKELKAAAARLAWTPEMEPEKL